MPSIRVDVWLYGPVARYAGERDRGSHAHLDVEMPEGCTLSDLVDRLGIPAEERGITFVNGDLAALPGLEADLGVALHDGDRVGIAHRKSMWPLQYRFGARVTSELQETLRQRQDRGVHHAYTRSDKES